MPELSIGKYKLSIGKKSIEDDAEKKEEETLSYAVSPTKKARGKLWSELEERVTQKIDEDKITKLLRVDALSFRLSQELIDFIIRPGFFLEGEKDIVDFLTIWYKKIKLIPVMERTLRSCIRTGNGWIELGYSEDGKDIAALRLIPNKSIDYIRDKSGNVKLDYNKEPEGFKIEKSFLGSEVIYKKDSIEKDGKTVWRPETEGEDGRDRIAHFILYDQEESYLGYTPLASCYKSGIVRLNLEDMTGEGAYRSQGLLIKVRGRGGAPATSQQLKNVAKDFKTITYQNIIPTKEDAIQVDRLPSPDIKGIQDLIYCLADLECSAMGIPMPLVLEPRGRGYRGDIEDKGIRFEFRIRALQARLGEQMIDKLFYRVMKARGMDLSKVPEIMFKSWMPQTQLSTARRRMSYSRYGLLSRDPEVELRIREEEALPTTFVQAELDKWLEAKKKGKPPKPEVTTPKKAMIENVIEDIIEEKLSGREH